MGDEELQESLFTGKQKAQFNAERSNKGVDSTMKDTMDINCLSFGNSLFIKIDSVNVIQNQFDKFLEKFTSQENNYRDVKLPLFIVSSFSKLFKHWLEFPDLKKLIGRDVFEKIFNEMTNIFEPKKLEDSNNQVTVDRQFDALLKEENSPSDLKVISSPDKNSACLSGSKSKSPSSLKSGSPSTGRQNPPPAVSYFKLFCNDCNDNVQIVNGDPRLSYNLHIKSEEHLRCFDPPKAGPHLSPSNVSNTEEAASSAVIIPTNSSVDCEDSSNGDDSENFKATSTYKLPTIYDPFCQPCCKNINAKELFMGKHLQSRSHEKQVILYEACRKILQEYEYCFSITNEDTFEFRCHICMKKQTGTNCFLQHCRTIGHLRNLEENNITK